MLPIIKSTKPAKANPADLNHVDPVDPVELAARVEQLEQLVSALVDRVPTFPLPGSPAKAREIDQLEHERRLLDDARSVSAQDDLIARHSHALNVLDGLERDPHIEAMSPAARERALLEHYDHMAKHPAQDARTWAMEQGCGLAGCCVTCCLSPRHRHEDFDPTVVRVIRGALAGPVPRTIAQVRAGHTAALGVAEARRRELQAAAAPAPALGAD